MAFPPRTVCLIPGVCAGCIVLVLNNIWNTHCSYVRNAQAAISSPSVIFRYTPGMDRERRYCLRKRPMAFVYGLSKDSQRTCSVPMEVIRREGGEVVAEFKMHGGRRTVLRGPGQAEERMVGHNPPRGFPSPLDLQLRFHDGRRSRQCVLSFSPNAPDSPLCTAVPEDAASSVTGGYRVSP